MYLVKLTLMSIKGEKLTGRENVGHARLALPPDAIAGPTCESSKIRIRNRGKLDEARKSGTVDSGCRHWVHVFRLVKRPTESDVGPRIGDDFASDFNRVPA